MRARLALLLGLVVSLASLAGCGGGGLYGYSRSYSALGEENPYLSRAVETSYEEVRRTRPDPRVARTLAPARTPPPTLESPP